MSSIGSPIADRCFETTQTTGTGTLTLLGAQSGFRGIISTYADGGVGYFCCTDDFDWEVFKGTITAAGNLLARTTVLASSNGGSAVNWGAGTRNVFSVIPALYGNAILDAGFRPHAEATPAMTVRLEAGKIFKGTGVTSVAAQSTGTITAPVGNPRIDRVVVDHLTGAVSVITGTPAGSPSAPGISSGKIPVAQVLLQTSSTVITDSMITDERTIPLAPIPGAVLLATATASASATIDFTGIDSTYDEYLVTLVDVVPTTDAVGLLARVSTDGGSTWKSGASDYGWSRAQVTDAGTQSGAGSAADTSITIAGNLSNAAARALNGEVRLFGPSSTASRAMLKNALAHMSSAGNYTSNDGMGAYTATGTAVNGLRLLMSSGTIASGKFALYGIRK